MDYMSIVRGMNYLPSHQLPSFFLIYLNLYYLSETLNKFFVLYFEIKLVDHYYIFLGYPWVGYLQLTPTQHSPRLIIILSPNK